MKKNGFTLIEIMAVIVILGIIGVIAVVAVDKTIKDNNEKLYKTQIYTIEEAARIWGVDHLEYLPDDNGEAITIPLVALKKDDLIDKEIKNPKTNELFYNNMYIDIIYKSGVYIYNVVEDSGSKTDNNLDVPVIILKDTLNKEIESGVNLSKDGFILDGASTLDSYSYEKTLNKDGTYNYSLTIDGFTVIRKITIK